MRKKLKARLSINRCVNVIRIVLLALLTACSFPTAMEPDKLQELLSYHEHIYIPEGEGPFPAIILLHTALGLQRHETWWAEKLRNKGYIVLVVDSFTPRELNPRLVAMGFRLWGRERAADLLVSLRYLRSLPVVDPERLAVIGWSHGGWAVLDALALSEQGKLSTGLTEPVPGGLQGLQAAVAFYPYCGFPSEANWSGWTLPIPVMILLSGQDKLYEPCLDLVQKELRSTDKVTMAIYSDMHHRFDFEDAEESIYNRSAAMDAYEKVVAFLALHLVKHQSLSSGANVK